MNRRFVRGVIVALLCILAFAGVARVLTAQGDQGSPTDPQLRLKWFDQHKAMEGQSPFKQVKWQFVGPTNISGRVVDVAVVTPRGKNYTIYAASATGGLWKTENDGTSWEPIWDSGPSASIGDVTIAPSDPNIVWMGTGEANIFRSSNAGIGVYKSTDAGKTWKHMGLAGTYTIPRIVIHPRNPEIVYVAASGHEWTDNEERGVFKTIDGGKTWQKVLYGNTRTGAIDLVMDPLDPNTLYAAMWQRIRNKWNDPRTLPDYTGSGIFKTTDAGKNWTPINRGLPEPKFRGRIGIDVARTRPNVVYAFLDNYEIARPAQPGEMDAYGRPAGGTIKSAEIYRSDDKGATWKKVSEPDPPMPPRQAGAAPQRPAGAPTTPMRTRMEGASGTYGWVFGQVRVDPNDENTVYFLGLGLNRSTDGGKTFYPIRGMHGDHHALWIDPANSNFLVNGNDGGLVLSYDKGQTWKNFTSGPGQLPLCQFFNVSYDMATPFRVYGSMQDHGSYRGPVDISRGRDRIVPVAFTGSIGGEGSTHAVNTEDNATVYASSFYGNLQRADMSRFDTPGQGGRGGRPAGVVTTVAPKPEKGELPLRGQWMAPTILSPHNQDIVYHGMQFLFRSMHRGDSWERISPDLTYNDTATMGDIPYHTLYAISESPKKFGVVYAGTDDGRTHVTKDGGKTWTEISKGLAPRKWVSRIVASQYDERTVYLTQNGKRDDDFAPYIWKSTDYGTTWKSIVANIPLGPVNVIREDPTDAKILYVGTDTGVYATTDGGASWVVLGAGLPSVYVHDLVVHPRDKMIVIGTHGRGMWAIDAVPVENYKKGTN